MKDRHEQSPATYGDIQRIIGLMERNSEENALVRLELKRLKDKIGETEELELIDIEASKKLSKRSKGTIRRLCPIRDFGANGRHLFDKKDVMKIKK